MKAVIDDDSEGVAELDALSAEVNDAINERDSVRLAKYFEPELDAIHTARGSSYWSESSETTSERDDQERQDAELRAALAIKVTEALSGDGLRVTRVTDTEHRNGYRVVARDNYGREYDTRVTFETAIQDAECRGPVGLVDRMVGWIVEGIRHERSRYFARMGV
jgi:hypothetical protein